MRFMQVEEDLVSKIKKEVDNMTSEQLQQWSKGKDCYDYLHR